jgi:hypothetical protein
MPDKYIKSNIYYCVSLLCPIVSSVLKTRIANPFWEGEKVEEKKEKNN